MSEFSVNAADLARTDTLEVFRRSPVLRAVQAVPIAEVQELLDAYADSVEKRYLDNATGYALDVIGRLVGAFPRPLTDSGTVVYFSPDIDAGAPDFAAVFVTGAPVNGLVPVNDVIYRAVIRTQIIKNHTRYGSAPELMYYGLFAYGIPVSVKSAGNGDVEVTLPASVSPDVVNSILSENSDETADHRFNMPLPSTSRIVRLSFRYPDAFGPDLDSGAPDVGYAGISYVVNP